MSFHIQLKNARINMGYTQEQVAKLIGIDKSTYSGYETGRREPDVIKLKKLAKLLNTSGDALLETGFEKSEDKQILKKNEAKILEIFNKLSPEFQQFVINSAINLLQIQKND